MPNPVDNIWSQMFPPQPAWTPPPQVQNVPAAEPPPPGPHAGQVVVQRRTRLGGMPKIDTKFNPWDVDSAQVDQLNQAQQDAIKQQQQIFDVQKGNVANLSNFDPMVNLAPLIGLTDKWTGSNFGKTYQAPESGQDRLNRIMALEQGLSKQQNDLTKDQLADLKASLQEKKMDHQSQQQYLMHWESLLNARDIASMRTENNVASPKKMSPQDLRDMGELRHQQDNLDQVYDKWKDLASGTGSYVQSKIPNTDPNKYEAARLQAGTDFGKAMLGNARSHEMLMTHVQMLPGSEDDDSKASLKIGSAKQLAAEKYNEKLKSFQDAGYDTGNLKPVELDKGPGSGASSGKNPWEMNW